MKLQSAFRRHRLRTTFLTVRMGVKTVQSRFRGGQIRRGEFGKMKPLRRRSSFGLGETVMDVKIANGKAVEATAYSANTQVYKKERRSSFHCESLRNIELPRKPFTGVTLCDEVEIPGMYTGDKPGLFYKLKGPTGKGYYRRYEGGSSPKQQDRRGLVIEGTKPKSGVHSFVKLPIESLHRVSERCAPAFGLAQGHEALANLNPVSFAGVYVSVPPAPHLFVFLNSSSLSHRTGEVEFDKNGNLLRWSNMSGAYRPSARLANQVGSSLNQLYSKRSVLSTASNPIACPLVLGGPSSRQILGVHERRRGRNCNVIVEADQAPGTRAFD